MPGSGVRGKTPGRDAERRSKRFFRVFRHGLTLHFKPAIEQWREKLCLQIIVSLPGRSSRLPSCCSPPAILYHAEPELPFSVLTARPAPLLSIHNPLVIPTRRYARLRRRTVLWLAECRERAERPDDFLSKWLVLRLLTRGTPLAPTALGRRGHGRCLPQGKGELPRFSDAPRAGAPLCRHRVSPSMPTIPAGTDTNGFQLLTVPSEGRTLQGVCAPVGRPAGSVRALPQWRASKIGPGLRPWGEQTATDHGTGSTVCARIRRASRRHPRYKCARPPGRSPFSRPRDFSYRYLRRMGRVFPNGWSG